jgi:NAD-specific glutamate dehydrogenase
MADLRRQQSSIAAAALAASEAKPGEQSVAGWVAANSEVAERVDRLMVELRASSSLSLAKLAVTSSQLRAVSGA